MTSNADHIAFAAAFTDLCKTVDGSGRLPGRSARKILARLFRVPAAARDAVLQDPERHFGSFDTLPEAAQRAILAAIRDRESWQLRGYQSSAWRLAIIRTLFGLRNRAPLGSIVRHVADAAAYAARRAPAELIDRVSRLQSRLTGRYAPLPTLNSILSVAGIDPRPLAVCYARPLEQFAAQRGYWHDRASHRTVGIVVGIDFLPTEAGFCYIESNGTFAQRAERSALYQVDPLVENMLDFAVAKGYRHLVLVDGNSDGIDPITAQRYEDGARRRNLKLTLVDRENLPKSKYLRSYGLPAIDTRDTLVLRTKRYPVAMDYIANVKNASLKALERYQAAHGDPDLLLPESGVEPVLGQAGASEPFPNAVYKLPEIDQARGVYFMKARSAEHAKELLADAIGSAARGSLQVRLQKLMDGRNGFYQAYLKSKMRPDRCLYIVRAHVLISPVGVQLLSAHQVISGTPVPTELPYGVVENTKPFMVNYSAGSRYEVVPQEDAASLTRAAEAVGRGLAWAFDYGFGANRASVCPAPARSSLHVRTAGRPLGAARLRRPSQIGQ